MSSEYIETETLFNKTEMNNELNINSLQNSPLSIQYTCYSEVPIDQSSYESTHLRYCYVVDTLDGVMVSKWD